ncbi:MAG: DHA2 family efflux MFS transporter permease subunit [Spirochaetales bacterium]|nr:MAG: DHA2 family efflux MFS transporter permease subunit [Spirochaetales bacterium]
MYNAPENLKRHTHKYLVLVIVLIGVLMSVLDGIVVNIALPTITADFKVDVASSQWAITAYLVTMTSLLLFFARISEKTGKTILFTLGFALFTFGSFACGLSRTLTQLIVFRVLQALGGAMVFSISGAILFLAFPPEERGRAMGYLGSTVAVGSILGPVLGGVLVDTLGWRYIFFINLPIGVIVVSLALIFLRIPEQKSPKMQMDWAGAGFLAVSLVSLMLLLSFTSAPVFLTARTAAVAVCFIASLTGFILRERKADRPLLDLRLFKVREFILPLGAMLFYFTGNFMMNVIGPFYFERVMGMRPLQVGLVFLIVPAVMAVLSPVSGLLYDKRYWPHYAILGMAVMCAAYIGLGLFARQSSLPGMAFALGVFGCGSALFQSPNTTDVMNALPREKTAVASSISSMVRNLGMSLGVAFATLLIPLQLKLNGGVSTVLSAERDVLGAAIANILFLSALVSLAAAVLLVRNKPIRRPV